MRTLAAATFSVALASASAHAALLVNGSFEQPDNGNSGFIVYNVAGQGIPGWAITSGDVDIDRDNLLSTIFVAQDGQQWIDLNGFGRGIIAQFIPTVVGQQYALEFFYSDNPFNNA